MSRLFAESVEKEPFADRVMENYLEDTKIESLNMKNMIEVYSQIRTL